MITGWILAGISLLAILGNLGTAFHWYTRRSRGSLVPLVGGLTGITACVTLPFPALRHWWWIPLVADPGSVFLVFAMVVFLVEQVFRGADTKID